MFSTNRPLVFRLLSNFSIVIAIGEAGNRPILQFTDLLSKVITQLVQHQLIVLLAWKRLESVFILFIYNVYGFLALQENTYRLLKKI
jgi:hypothetical protein